MPAFGPCFGWHRASLFGHAIRIGIRRGSRTERAQFRTRKAHTHVPEDVQKEGVDPPWPRP